jgi:hypothetical protein
LATYKGKEIIPAGIFTLRILVVNTVGEVYPGKEANISKINICNEFCDGQNLVAYSLPIEDDTYIPMATDSIQTMEYLKFTMSPPIFSALG